MIGSVHRALEVLIYLADNKEVGVRQLARDFSVNKATAYRLLSTLEQSNFVSQDQVTKKYRLGVETIRIGFSCLNNLRIVQVAKPYLEELSRKTNETVCLMIRQGSYGVYIDKIDSSQTVRVHAEIGQSTPLISGSASKALIAFLSLEEQNDLLNEFDNLLIDHSLSKDILLNEFALIRKQGYAVSDEEIDPGVIAFGCPVFGFGNKLLASVSIPIPKGRADNEYTAKIICDLKATTEQISQKLGY